MVIASWTALAGFAAAAAFASESGTRYVFCLLDSGFRVQSRMETVLAHTDAPDTAAVRAKAQSLATWPMGIQMNTSPIDGVWMAFEPPADPGDVVFVSDTDPVQPLLVLRIDAMCQGCVHAYETFGHTSIPGSVGDPAGDPVVTDLDERFGYGMKTTDAEKAAVAHALSESGFPATGGPVRVHVLKHASPFPSKEGITYIAYYGVPAVVASLHPVGIATAKRGFSVPEVDVLGRRVLGARNPASLPLRADRASTLGK